MVGLAAAYFYLVPQRLPRAYQESYRLVPEKVSQSAAIPIYLPSGVDKDWAKDHVVFNPEIRGKWLAEKTENKPRVLASLFDNFRALIRPGSNTGNVGTGTLYFQPDADLKLNRHYEVELTIDQTDGKLREDFLAVDNPEVLGIFPTEGSEAPETSEITLVFNRPMVPLTTLGYLESKEIPVEITPATPGRFKWITTRNLQFLPQDRLRRSSNYQIKVKSGLVSVEGLTIEPLTGNFTTRKLRYINVGQGQIVYNQPIVLRFNQPVDLEKIRREISLLDQTAGRQIDFVAEYQNEPSASPGRPRTLNQWQDFFLRPLSYSKPAAKTVSKEENQSVVWVFPARDRFGREKLWDFDHNYSLKINKAYPLEGDIILEESRETYVTVGNVIQNVRAFSERTNFASPSFFDPQGKLQVSFSEEIDLQSSQIRAPKLDKIDYGEKCQDEATAIYNPAGCEKTADKKTLVFSFKADQIGLNETLEIVFDKIVNSQGLTINAEPIRQNLVSYPTFKILNTSPADSEQKSNVSELVICSNTPILVPDPKDYKNYLEANLDYEMTYWGGSWRVTNFWPEEKCRVNEFHTNVGYGLAPEADYRFELAAQDVFGQKASWSWGFTTGPMPSEYLNFYHFQKNYSVSPSSRTKLTYAVQNMEYVNLDICRLSALDFIYYLDKKPRFFDPPQTIAACSERISKTINLTKKYWGKNYFQVDLKDYFADPLGFYVLTFSHPGYRTDYWDWETGSGRTQKQVYERTFLNVTNLGVGEKRIQPELAYFGENQALTENQLASLKNLYWITDLVSLEPVKSARVNLYRGKNFLSAGTFLTDETGVALTRVVSDLKGVVVSAGQDQTVILDQEDKLDWASSASQAKKLYLYTDKPIYRPGQEVYVKGIYRLGYDGSYEIFREKPVKIQAYNSRREEVFNQDLEVSDFGTINAKFLLDKSAPLGGYRICADNYNCAYIDVQEYRPAAFEVKTKTDKEEYVSKDIINLDVETNYYFGVPLESGTVSYTFSSQNYYFDRNKLAYYDRYSDGYWHFGPLTDYWQPYYYGDRFLFRGETELTAGKARISQPLDMNKLFANEQNFQSKIIVVDVTVTNDQGQSVSGQKSFILHAGNYYLGLKSDDFSVGKNEETNLRIKSLDVRGKPLKVGGLGLKAYKVDWIYAKRQEATGGYGYQWEKKKDLVWQESFDTDNEGNYAKAIRFDKEGEYELEASGRDQKDNLVSSSLYLYVWGEGQTSIRPREGADLELQAEKTDLKVNEEGNVIIKSPYPKAKALIAIERGRIFDYQIKDIEGSLHKFNFVAKEEYLPNVFVSVLLQSGSPEVRFGKLEFKIETKTRELQITVKPNKTFYLPGEEVVLDLETKNNQDQPEESELSLAVVDLSVLALKGNQKKNPLVFFYGGFPLTVAAASNLKNILVETEMPKTKGGAGAAFEKSDLAKRVRGEFRETAFWSSVVRTGKDGRAQIKFTLPDNLTRWQAETVGVTKDTKLGVNYQEFTTQKPLMVVSLQPRFVVPGDEFSVGTKIFNQSEENLKLEVSFESAGLVLNNDAAKKQLRVDRNETQTVYFNVRVPEQPEEGSHRFVLSAQGNGLADTVVQYIKITPNNTYETVSTANYTTEETAKEYVFLPENVVKNKGSLSISGSATLAVFLSDALNYLISYPYGSAEQISSQLNSIAIVKRGLNLPNLVDKLKLKPVKYEDKEYGLDELIEIGLAKLYNNQNYDGGFSYWRDNESNFYATLSVAETLENLSLAGYKINQNSLERAANFLDQKLNTDDQIYSYKDNVVLAGYVLSQLPDWSKRQALKEKLVQLARDDLYLKEQASNTSLAYLAIVMAKPQADFPANLKKKITDTLNNRLDIDSRGAFLEPNQNLLWYYYETPIKDTALYLKALAENKSDNPVLEEVVRWLLNSREKDGAWGSTNNTLSVVDAFTEFLAWKQETQADFTLEISANEKSIGDFHFEPKTILEQFRKVLGIGELKFNENNVVKFSKTDQDGRDNAFYYDLALKYYLPAEKIAPRDEGFSITRDYYRLSDTKNEKSVLEANPGDILRVHLQITAPKTRHFVAVEDYIPAGLEIVNLDLTTEQKSLRLQEKEITGREFYPSFKELRDDRAFLFTESLRPGVYEFDYYVRALAKGKFTLLPATAYEMYTPENFGRTASGYFEVR